MSGPEVPLTVEQANEAFDVLVEHAGASLAMRSMFVHNQTTAYVDEWRFSGALGFGGKFWRDPFSDGLKVNFYKEDSTPERQRIMQETNTALNNLVARWRR